MRSLSASIGTVNSITDSSDLSFESAGTNTVTTFLDDTGHLYVDHNGGEGGTILNIGGTLTNSGYLSIGNATLSAPDEVTAASLDNTGKIYLTGSSADQALLDVAGSAGFGTAGVLSGYVRLAGDSAIEFASGEITSLAADAHLGLVGSDAFIEDSTATGSNSALTGLASIGAGALFALHDGAAVSTTGALVNDGNVYLDTNAGDGGSSLTLAGALTNSQELGIGNATLSASDKVTAASLDNTGSIQSDRLQRQPGAPRRDRGQRGIRDRGSPERPCSTDRRQRDRVRERADHQPGGFRAIGPERKRRLHRGQHGAGVEQRSDGARFDRRRGDVRSRKRGRGVDDRRARQ